MDESRKEHWRAVCAEIDANAKKAFGQLMDLQDEGFTEAGSGKLFIGFLISASRYLSDNVKAFSDEHLKPKD